MSQILTGFIWVARSSAGNLKRKSKALIGRDVTLFPDAGKFELWDIIAKENGFDISEQCEGWSKDGLIGEKDDIADYYLKNFSQYLGTIKVDPEWEEREYQDLKKRMSPGRVCDKLFRRFVGFDLKRDF